MSGRREERNLHPILYSLKGISTWFLSFGVGAAGSLLQRYSLMYFIDL